MLTTIAIERIRCARMRAIIPGGGDRECVRTDSLASLRLGGFVLPLRAHVSFREQPFRRRGGRGIERHARVSSRRQGCRADVRGVATDSRAGWTVLRNREHCASQGSPMRRNNTRDLRVAKFDRPAGPAPRPRKARRLFGRVAIKREYSALERPVEQVGKGPLDLSPPASLAVQFDSETHFHRRDARNPQR